MRLHGRFPDPIVIVGGGLTAARAAKTVRDEGYTGELMIMSAEPHHPHQRPPLSKAYLRNETNRDGLFPLVPNWYVENDVEIWMGTTVQRLDPAAHRIFLADGTHRAYSRLLLATGSSPRALPVRGNDLRGVLSLRSIESADLLRLSLLEAQNEGDGRIVIVGDGWIGMEVAASARLLGLDVTIIGRSKHPLQKALGPEMGAFFADVHSQHGVKRQRGQLATIEGEHGRVRGVRLQDGSHLPADLVLIAVGATPNVALASSAGIALAPPALGGGVAVNSSLTTSNEDVFAAGDVASIPSITFGRLLRVEHWDTALRSGSHAGAAMVGPVGAYDHLPYIYSDQFDVGMEYTGFVNGPDDFDRITVSGCIAERTFVAFWTMNDHVRAGMTVNCWDQIPTIKALIRQHDPVSIERLEAFHDDAGGTSMSVPTEELFRI